MSRKPWRRQVDGPLRYPIVLTVSHEPDGDGDPLPWRVEVTNQDTEWASTRRRAKARAWDLVDLTWWASGKARPVEPPQTFNKPQRRAIIAAAAEVAAAIQRENAEAAAETVHQVSADEAMDVLKAAIVDVALAKEAAA